MADVTINDHSAEYMNNVESALDAALDGIGLFLADEAAYELENTPRRVDTERLKNSITREVVLNEQAVYVGTNVEYAIYVHEGTVNMEANRFLKNAVERNKDQIDKYIKDALS